MGDGRRRAVVEGVTPLVDGGRFPIKRVAGDRVVVEADAFADGHDVVLAALRHRAPRRAMDRGPDGAARQRSLARLVRRRRGGPPRVHGGRLDRPLGHLARDLVKRLDAGQDVTVDLKIGANLVDLAVRRAAADGATEDAEALERWAARLREGTRRARRARR